MSRTRRSASGILPDVSASGVGGLPAPRNEREEPMRITILCFLVAAAFVLAEEGMPKPPRTNAQLDLMKGLAGEWLRVGEDGKPTDTVGATYRVTSGGSAVIETLLPGTDHEMITMYYLDGDDLVLTHYCALANQPHMKADPKSAEKTISFKFAGGANIDATKDMHMHDAVFTFADKDHLKTAWTLWAGGKAKDTYDFSFVRK
jgi:hypothetical protein